MTAITATLTGANQPLTITADGDYYLDVGGPLRTVGQFNSIHAIFDSGTGTLTAYATPTGLDADKIAIPGAVLTGTGTLNLQVKSRGYILVLSGSAAPSIRVWCQ